MTKDEARDAIAKALMGDNTHLTHDGQQLADHIAIALDALGLLNFAAAWNNISPANRRLASQAAHDIATEAVRILQSQQLSGINPEVPLASGNVTLKCDPGNFGAAFSPNKGDD